MTAQEDCLKLDHHYETGDGSTEVLLHVNMPAHRLQGKGTIKKKQLQWSYDAQASYKMAHDSNPLAIYRYTHSPRHKEHIMVGRRWKNITKGGDGMQRRPHE